MSQGKLAFVVAGAQKSGTCTLDAILRLHPQIQMASVKETHFFDDEEREWKSSDYSGIDKYFTGRDDRLRGEATPITMYWRPAVRRLHHYNPDLRILIILRNPVVRAFSQWRHEYSQGRETMPFGEAIRGGRCRVRSQGTTEGLHRVFSYVERGLYGDQLCFLSRYFPKTNIHCEIYEEFFDYRSAGLERIANFLGIKPFPAEIPDIRLNPSLAIAYPSTLSREDIIYLSGLFHHQIEEVEKFLARQVPSWRAQVREAV